MKHLDDDEREDMLIKLGVKFQFASTPAQRREIWHEIQVLRQGRSADRVQQAEKSA